MRASFPILAMLLPGNPFTLTINNLPATGIDFGDGNPQYFAFWNASILDINQGKTTTLTTVTDTPVETSGVAFDGCFKTVKVCIWERWEGLMDCRSNPSF